MGVLVDISYSGAHLEETSLRPPVGTEVRLYLFVPVAEEELRFMREMCEDHAPNTLLVVTRELIEAGINESFRAIKPQEATIDMVAIHGEVDDV